MKIEVVREENPVVVTIGTQTLRLTSEEALALRDALSKVVDKEKPDLGPWIKIWEDAIDTLWCDRVTGNAKFKYIPNVAGGYDAYTYPPPFWAKGINS